MEVILVRLQLRLEELAQFGIDGGSGRITQLAARDKPRNFGNEQGKSVHAARKYERVAVPRWTGDLDAEVTRQVDDRDHFAAKRRDSRDRLGDARQVRETLGIQNSARLLDTDGEAEVSEPEGERASRAEVHVHVDLSSIRCRVDGTVIAKSEWVASSVPWVARNSFRQARVRLLIG